MSWNVRTLGEVCDEVGGVIQTGPFGSQLHESDYVEEGVPVVMPKNIIDGRISTEDIARISEVDAKRLQKHALAVGDIVYGRRGDIGRRALVTERERGWLCGTGCLRVSLGYSVLDPTFLYYYLGESSVTNWIANQAIGATLPNLNTSILRSVSARHPSLFVQRRIGSILSAYDNLIGSNARRIKILEEMARMIYREWFVNFRFPGHENVQFVESECGRKPHGWTAKPLGEVATITMGLSPKGDTYNENGDGLPLINGPVEFDERFTKAVKWTTKPTKLCKEGDLIVCVRGSTTGRYVKSDATYCLGRGVCALSSKYQCFVDLLFQDQLPTLLRKTSGSTFPSWTGPQLKSHLVPCPPLEELDRFETTVRPLSAVVLVCSRQIRNLRKTRDLLLPKLISGQISVGHVETEAVAQSV